MYKQWTRDDIKDSLKRISRLYVKAPVEYRFLCGHAIQSEDDEDVDLQSSSSESESENAHEDLEEEIDNEIEQVERMEIDE